MKLIDGKPIILDTFCGAGGVARGYQWAGFYVVGVDIRPQPRFAGDEFHQADALDVLRRLIDGEVWQGYRLGDFAAFHASPPCQAFSSVTVLVGQRRDHPDLIEPTRALLVATGLPYVIENVHGAPLERTAVLCGSSFGLGVRRHRLFESNVPMLQPGCQHAQQGVPMGVYGHPGGGESSQRKDKGKKGSAEQWAAAMGIDWMTAAELAQAIPPAYTEHVGAFLLAEVEARQRAAA